MEKLKGKLKEDEGATFFHMVVLFLVGMCLFNILFEFVRVKLIIENVNSAYVRAIRTVTTENYNEVYSGFREDVYIGGQYSGGPEGGGDEEYPEWESLHDTGDVEEELAELLKLNEDGGTLKSEQGGYTLTGFDVKVKDGNVSELGRYEVKGKLNLTVSFAIGGFAVGKVEIPIDVQTKYGENF